MSANWPQGVTFTNFFWNRVCFESNYQGDMFSKLSAITISETSRGRDSMAFRQWDWQNRHGISPLGLDLLKIFQVNSKSYLFFFVCDYYVINSHLLCNLFSFLFNFIINSHSYFTNTTSEIHCCRDVMGVPVSPTPMAKWHAYFANLIGEISCCLCHVMFHLQ